MTHKTPTKLGFPSINSSNDIVLTKSFVDRSHMIRKTRGGSLCVETNPSLRPIKPYRMGSLHAIMTSPGTGTKMVEDVFADKVITVKVSSNYGNKARICCSSMMLLDSSRIPILNQRVTSVPQMPQTSLDRLTDRVLIKDEGEAIWSSEWPPKGYSDITFFFTVPHSVHPRFLRVWNQKGSGDSSIKDVTVISEWKSCFSGVVPIGFGIDIQFNTKNQVEPSKSIPSMQDILPSQTSSSMITDRFGNAPLITTNTISFEIVSNWGDETNIGVHYIDIINENNMYISIEDIDHFRCDNCIMRTDVKNLVKTSRYSSEANNMFIAETRWHSAPLIVFSMKKCMKIAGIRIGNFDATNRNHDIGIKNIKIYANENRLIWVGRIPKGEIAEEDGTPKGYCIWFCDFPSIRMH